MFRRAQVVGAQRVHVHAGEREAARPARARAPQPPQRRLQLRHALVAEPAVPDTYICQLTRRTLYSSAGSRVD